MISKITLAFVLFATVVLSSSVHARRCPRYRVQVFSRSARYPSGISRVVSSFKTALGGEDNGNSPGPLPAGQRSINWDAAALPFDMPFDFFNTVAPRGAIFKTRNNEFRVSNTNNASDIDDRFNSIVPDSVADQFQSFSPLRLFAPLESNRMSTVFRVPASSDRAAVVGFGAVFTDVDRRRGTSIRAFDANGCLIARVVVPPRSKGLSFTGIIVRNRRGKKVPVIARIVLKLGNISLARVGKGRRFRRRSADVVVMDDFFYGEPQKLD